MSLTKKNIVFISTMKGFSWGGSEELWCETALYARSHGHHLNSVLFKNLPVDNKIALMEKAGIVVSIIDEQKAILPSFLQRIIFKLLKKRIPIKYTDRFSFLNKLNPDIVILNQAGCTDILYYSDLRNYFKKLKTPYFILNHHNHEYGSLGDKEKDILIDLFKKAKKIFFVAERNKEVLERQLATDFSYSEIVKNPVNLSEIKIIEWPVTEIFQIAVVARLDTNFKGQDILVQTLAKTKWKFRRFVLNLYGQGPDEAYLKSLIHFYGLEQKVFLKGQTQNIAKVWQEHHLLILPSHSEGMPLSLLEAMLCGRPCLVTDVGDSAALIVDNETGWVAQTASVRALDQALEKAWNQKQNWKQIGLIAHKKALSFIDSNPGKTLFEKLINE